MVVVSDPGNSSTSNLREIHETVLLAEEEEEEEKPPTTEEEAPVPADNNSSISRAGQAEGRSNSRRLQRHLAATSRASDIRPRNSIRLL
jgi:hypothetical protein